MRLATKKDTELAVRIISKSFASNPSVLWVVKQDRKIKARIQALAQYSFQTALRKKGAYLSSNGKGIALCYRAKYQQDGFMDYWNQFILVIRSIGISQVRSVLKREAYVKSQRPKQGDYLYFWFYGVEPGFNGMGDAKELKDEIFDMARNEKLTIYMETSVDKNCRVYQRYGFELYHTWWVEEKKLNLYFLRKKFD